MKIPIWFKSIFASPEFSDIKTDDVVAALHDHAVRRHWLESVLSEVRDIHMRTHMALMNGKLDERFVQESARLQGIDWTLRQILNSKNSVELARRSNRTDDSFGGVAVAPAP
jgi:phage terminase large subunit